MSMTGLPKLPFNPGLPSVARAGAGALQGALWRFFQTNGTWTITYATGEKKGKPLSDPRRMHGAITSVVADSLGLQASLSTVTFDYTKTARISDFPVEKGGFAVYNKVEMPATPMISLALTGSVKSRQKFLADIDAAVKSTDLFNIATPNRAFMNYSIEQYSYRQSADRGANLLVVDLMLKEVREVDITVNNSDKKTKNAKTDTAAESKDSGKVQGEEQSFSSKVTSKIKGFFK